MVFNSYQNVRRIPRKLVSSKTIRYIGDTSILNCVTAITGHSELVFFLKLNNICRYVVPRVHLRIFRAMRSGCIDLNLMVISLHVMIACVNLSSIKKIAHIIHMITKNIHKVKSKLLKFIAYMCKKRKSPRMRSDKTHTSHAPESRHMEYGYVIYDWSVGSI